MYILLNHVKILIVKNKIYKFKLYKYISNE